MTCDRTTPPGLVLRAGPRRPVTDPTLGVAVPRREAEPARHRLVTLGDSLTQGFMSAAVYRTDLSWPAITAFEMGLTAEEFQFPVYEPPSGPGGLPLDLERLARAFERRFGARPDFWEYAEAALWARAYLDRVEDYWERGPGSGEPPRGDPLDNLAVYAWDVLDAQLLTASTVAGRIATPRDDLFAQIVENHNDRAARVVLRRTGLGDDSTVLDAAARMASPAGGGVETLVVMLGANNALGAVVGLRPCWTDDGYGALSAAQRLAAKRRFTVWRPEHFAAEWASLVRRLRTIEARHVIIGTIPSVTIAPIARGVGGKIHPGSRYFAWYTRPWIDDDSFDPARDPHLTAEEAWAVDSAIDAYNETIVGSVEEARREGRDWYVFELAGLLDSLAVRRYVESPWARPPWWKPYDLPPELRALDPVPNTRFFRSGPGGRVDGGLFSLDGVHPTTVGYGLVAQGVIDVMQSAGVTFRTRDGHVRDRPVRVDFGRLLRADTLLSDPPAAVSPTLGLLAWLDDRLDWVRRTLPFLPAPL